MRLQGLQCRTEGLAVSFFLIVLLGVLGVRCRMEVQGLGVGLNLGLGFRGHTGTEEMSKALQVASPFLLQGS